MKPQILLVSHTRKEGNYFPFPSKSCCAAVVLLRPGDKMEGGLEGEGHGGLNHGGVVFFPRLEIETHRLL